MSLATQCPHCKTTFRVAQDQLKLRAGLVRCGACREIFNGIEHLLSDDEIAEPPHHPAAPTVGDAETGGAQNTSTTLDFAYPDFHFGATAPLETAADTAGAASDRLETIEAVDFVETPKTHSASKPGAGEPVSLEPLPAALSADETYTIEAVPAEPFLAEIEQMEAELAATAEVPPEAETEAPEVPVPTRNKKKKRRPDTPSPNASPSETTEPSHEREAAPEEEPDFVKQGRRKQQRSQILRVAAIATVLLLLFGALGQCVFAFREQIAVRLPQSKHALMAACRLLHCQIELPMQIENISIESHALETLSGNKDSSELSLTLRNIGGTAQAWPHVELTLNDSDGTLLARRVFAPRDYMADAHAAAQGLPANSEQFVKIYVGFQDVKPAGYRVGVFYP
ncbi:MAG: zinc-ribbon domain-containing protein [Burkholderiaceae bacterium]|nr:zinc-ribbon domain-containing protein [Burkholderiaceae bacterium]